MVITLKLVICQKTGRLSDNYKYTFDYGIFHAKDIKFYGENMYE